MQTEKLASLGFGHDGRQLQGNLDKVVQHGKRADAIVKNMLLHSRQGSGEHRPVDINALVDESLNLAYHGARAGKQGFDLYFTSESSLDPSAIEMCFAADAIVRDEGKTITGVAAIKAWRIESGEKYHHTIEPLSVSALGGKIMGSKRIGLPGN